MPETQPDALVEQVAEIIDPAGWNREQCRKVARAIIPLIRTTDAERIKALEAALVDIASKAEKRLPYPSIVRQARATLAGSNSHE